MIYSGFKQNVKLKGNLLIEIEIILVHFRFTDRIISYAYLIAYNSLTIHQSNYILFLSSPQIFHLKRNMRQRK